MIPKMQLLVSSLSARGRALHDGREVARILHGAGWEVDVHVTHSSDAVSDAARSCAPGLVGAVGGDGYLAEVASGLAHDPDRIMVPFPGGRGNDLCRALGIGVDAAERAEELAELGIEGRERLIDGIWVGEENKLALGVVSLGVDRAANEQANKSLIRWGSLAYAWGAIFAFLKFKPLNFNIVSNEDEDRFPGWICSISNSGWIGGGINIVPQSNLSDGVLEVFSVEKTSRARAVRLLAKVLTGRSLDSPLVRVTSNKEVTITEPVGVSAMADGDFIARVPFTAKVAPAVVRIIA